MIYLIRRAVPVQLPLPEIINTARPNKMTFRWIACLLIPVLLIGCQEQKSDENIVVIGGGLMGSAAAWQLARQGEQVLLLEQQDSIYTFGSSFGDARISRALGPRNDLFTYLQQRSVQETQQLLDFLAEKSGQTQSMDEIYHTSPVTYIYYNSEKMAFDQLVKNQSIPTKYATNADDAKTKFDLSVPDSALVIREINPYSGTLNPRVLIHKMQEGFRLAGGTIRFRHRVTQLIRTDDGFELEVENLGDGSKVTIHAARVVSAAGPYNGQLLKDIAPYVSELIHPQRVFLNYFKIDPQVYQSLTGEQKAKFQDYFPVADMTPEIMYAMVEKWDPDGSPVLKIGGHYLRQDITNLDNIWQKEVSSTEVAWGRDHLARYLQQLHLPITGENLIKTGAHSCVYSLTRTETPYVCSLMNLDKRQDPNLVLVGGMSGIGAKGTLTYGLIAANILLGKEDPAPIYHQVTYALGFQHLISDLKE